MTNNLHARWLRALGAGALAFLLAACDGGGPVFRIGGTVSGLAGTLVLQEGRGLAVSVSGNGPFAFEDPLPNGQPYQVSVRTQPAGQTCTVANGSGTVADADVANIVVTCAGGDLFTVGGMASGLTGSVVLQNNGGDDLTLGAAAGSFVFAAPLANGAPYNVSVLTQPPGQTCSVANGSGTVLGGDVGNVVVTCNSGVFGVGGTVAGLSGTLVLQNNGGDNLSLGANGAFAFATALAPGATYSVSVLTQPAGQSCTVGNASGTVPAAQVTNVAVNCVSALFTVGGSISGLGGSVVLQNNGGDDLTRNTNGAFTFASGVPHGSAYAVSVLTQPAGQTCTVANGSGTVNAADVSNIAVTCASATVTIGGTISGLAGTLVLQNNGGDNLSRSANGAFTFPSAIAQGAPYAVTVLTQPAGQTCTVANGSGSANAAVSNVAVSCAAVAAVPAPTLSLGFAIKQLQFSWTASAGATHYRLWQRPDYTTPIVPPFVQVGGDIPAGTTSAALDIAVHAADWANALYYVEACNAGTCSASAQINAAGARVGAIGYFKASNTGASNDFGNAVALSADGNTLAVAAWEENSDASGIGGDQTNLGAGNSGAVYVFVRSGATWSQQAYIKASNADSDDRFGAALALSADGNTLAVGARGEDSNATGVNGDQGNNAASASGAVYVFVRSGSAWSQQAYVKASNTAGLDEFGAALALSGDGNTLAVGAAAEDSSATGIDGNQADNSAQQAGAVYLFTRSAGAWSQQAYVKASNTDAGDTFGDALALASDGNTLAVGAGGEDGFSTGVNGDQSSNVATSAGAVYVFIRSGAAWSQQAYVKASNTGTVDFFGRDSVALSGDGNTLAVGAEGEDSNAIGIGGDGSNNSRSGSGAAYVFARSGTAWSQQAYIKASNPGSGDAFGSAAALSADGSTLAVGAPNESSAGVGSAGEQVNAGASGSGAGYLFVRSGATWTQRNYVKAPNTGSFDQFGGALALSADGSTLAVGAVLEDSAATGVGGNQADNSALNPGAAYLY